MMFTIIDALKISKHVLDIHFRAAHFFFLIFSGRLDPAIKSCVRKGFLDKAFCLERYLAMIQKLFFFS